MHDYNKMNVRMDTVTDITGLSMPRVQGTAAQLPESRLGWTLGVLLILCLGLVPVYLFPSGGFQIIDIPLSIIIAASLLFGEKLIIRKYRNIFLFLLPFVLWVCIVNGLYYIKYENPSFLYGTIPVVYGFFLLISFTIIFHKILTYKQIAFIYLGLVLSLFLCLIAKGYSEEGRAVLSFNDPNQVGYFAIFLVCYVIFLNNYREIIDNKNIKYDILNILILFFAHYLVILSFSRSTILAFIFLDLCLIKNIKNIRYLIAVLLTSIIFIIVLFLFKPTLIEEKYTLRKEHLEEKIVLTHLKMRWLDPFSDYNGIDFLFGAGTGARISSDMGKASKRFHSEVHNLFGEILRAFGIIGLLLFGLWLYKFIKTIKNIKDIYWILGSIFIYNLGIYGLRWRAFWIFFSLLLALSNITYQNKLKFN